ncbi:MAG TPA: hypothetical protein PKC28_06455 [Bdellovibrionales bacterium]|nr:hypothetical protein [Bdellovibrionales bacterium]
MRFKDGVAEWTVPEDSPYFAGHFPNHPVFPAVAIVDASVYLLTEYLRKPDPRSVPSAKFMSPITPGQNVRVELKNLNETEWAVEWKDQTSGRLAATLRIRL